MDLKIDKEFKALLQPLSKEEYEQLKQNLIDDGCREPLVAWGDIIVDGHNRFEICTANNIAFEVVRKSFADRQEAMDWIDKNQLGRRNMTPDQLIYVQGRIYERRKKYIGEHKGNQHTKLEWRQNGAIPNGRTRDALAKELGVGSRTLNRAAAGWIV